MHNSGQKCAYFCSEWCIVGYRTGALWDLWNWPIHKFCSLEFVFHQGNLSLCWYITSVWGSLSSTLMLQNYGKYFRYHDLRLTTITSWNVRADHHVNMGFNHYGPGCEAPGFEKYFMIKCISWITSISNVYFRYFDRQFTRAYIWPMPNILIHDTILQNVVNVFLPSQL